MAFSYNHVTLVGRLTRNPERITISESLVKTVFYLAVQRGYKKEQGQKSTDFIPITLWGKTGDLAFTMLKKGVPVLVWGRVQIRSYQVGDVRQWGVEIAAENFQLLQSRSPDALVSVEDNLAS